LVRGIRFVPPADGLEGRRSEARAAPDRSSIAAVSRPSDSGPTPARFDRLALVAVALLALGAAAAATRHLAWSYDSGTYALMSQELLAGRGFATRVVEPEHARGARSEPQLTKQPLYPAALAALGGLTLARDWPARAIQVAAHVATALALFLLVRRLTGSTAALAAGAIVALGFPTLYVAHWIWTEALFVALSVAWLAALVAARQRPTGSRSLALGGVLAALVIATRQAGLFVLPVLAWEIVARRRSGPGRRQRLSDTAVLFAPSAVVLLATAVRNFRLAGSVTGIERPDQGRALGEVAAEFARQIDNLLSVPGWNAVSRVALALTAISVVLYVRRAIVARDGASELRRGFDLPLVALGSYTLVVAWGMARYQPRFEPRFFVPWVVLALPVGVIAVAGLCRSRPGTAPHRACAAGRTLLLTTLVGLSVASSAVRWSTDLSQTGVERSPVFVSRTFAWAQRHLRPGELVASNAVMELALRLDLSVVALPERRWNPRQALPVDGERWLADRLRAGGGRYLILVARSGELPAAEWGEFVASAARREPGSGFFRRLWDSDDGVVYELADRAVSPGSPG